MFVQVILSSARDRLATLPVDAPLLEAAAHLRVGTDLIVVCDRDGRMKGVVSKTDVVDQISHCEGATCRCAVATVMTTDVLHCRAEDQLPELWSRMQARGIKNVPLVDAELRPLGIVTARDALQVLLSVSESEELLLRDYVMGFGYR